MNQNDIIKYVQARDTWVQAGIDQGFIVAPVCAIHDDIPTSEEEDHEMSDGYDCCLVVLRLCGPGQSTAINANMTATHGD